MRSHEAIVAAAGQDDELAARLGVKAHVVRDWRVRKSIPSGWWRALVRHELATFEELAAGAEARRLEQEAKRWTQVA